MPFFPACSIDGCLRIFEPEIRYSLCPRAKRDTLKEDMRLLKESKELTCKTIEDPAINGGREADRAVVAWMENVDRLSNDVKQLLDSLSATSCCRLCSNYRNGRRVEEMLRRVTNLKEDRKKWDTHDKLFRPNAPRDSAPTASEIPESSSSVQAEPRTVDESENREDPNKLSDVEAPQVSAPTANNFPEGSSSVQAEPRAVDERKKWEDPNKLSDVEAPQVSAPTANNFSEGSSTVVQAEPTNVDEHWKWEDPNKLSHVEDPPPVSAPTPDEITEESATVDQELWALFLSYAMGGAADADLTGNTSISLHARQIVNTLVECCGTSNELLSLAMRVVAASLKQHSVASQWGEANRKLREIASSDGKETSITSQGTPIIERILRLCYERLGDDLSRRRLSSCASFDYMEPVGEHDIIYSWMGEGLLDDTADFDETYEQGRRVIDQLRAAHWLRSSDLGDYFLIMDDRIQCMLRNASGHKVISTPTGAGGGELQSWRDAGATRVLVKHPVSSLPQSPHAFAEARLPECTPVCPHLVSLLLFHNESITRIHDDLFRFTPRLLVLDLSHTNIEVLPPSIGLLRLLRFLGLSNTKISSLPIELGDMGDLRLLRMDENSQLKGIRRECITKLSKLRALTMTHIGHEWNQSGSEYLSLEDLRGMTGIRRLALTARTNSDLDKMRCLLGSVLTGLTLQSTDFTYARSVLSSLNRLDFLQLINCPGLDDLAIENGHLGCVTSILLDGLHVTRIAPEAVAYGGSTGGFEWFLPTLRHLVITRCHCLMNLTWIGHLPNLVSLLLNDCKEMSTLIDKGGPGDSNAGSEEPDDGGVSFPSLQGLLLVQLPQLRSFSWRHHPLRLPSLRTLVVEECPMLKKLPLGRSSCSGIKQISGTWDWWSSLDSDFRDRFGAYYTPCG